MAPKVLVSDKLSETAVQIFRDRGIDVDFMPDLGKDKDKLAAVIGQYDGLAIRSATTTACSWTSAMGVACDSSMYASSAASCGGATSVPRLRPSDPNPWTRGSPHLGCTRRLRSGAAR